MNGNQTLQNWLNRDNLAVIKQIKSEVQQNNTQLKEQGKDYYG